MDLLRSQCRSRRISPLVILLTTFAVLVLLHGWATPLFEAPDEVWHYAYARWLAEGQGLPSMADNASGANQEVAQPPLYYGVAALLSDPFPDSDLGALFWHNPGFGYQARGTVPDNKNMLIHTSAEQWPWRGAVLTVHMARLASLLFGLLTVLAAWGLGYETFQERRGALLTASLVAFQPQFVFMSSVVSNDSAAAALSTAALWLAARILRRGGTRRRSVGIGLLVGLAALTKTSALLLVPLVGATLLWQGWRERRPLKSRLGDFAGYAAALAVGGWWYARNFILYGDPLGLASHLHTLWGRPQPVSLLALLPELPLLWRSFWGAYGWGHVFWPEWVYVILTGGTAIFALRTAWVLIRRHREGKQSATLTPILALTLLWGAGIFAALLLWMREVAAPHGRLLFPAIGTFALWVAAGMRLAPPSWGRRHLAHGLLLALAMTTILAPGARILTTFAPPRLEAPSAALQRITPVGFDYGGCARLLGVAINAERLAPGEPLEVRACWEALRPMQQDYTVFVHLFGPEDRIVAQRHTYPGLGRFPSSLWPVGRAFCDTYRMTVEPWAEGPILYRLEVGLFDRESGDRLPTISAGGEPADSQVVANIAVAPRTAPPPPAIPVDALLGDAIALRGYDAPVTVIAGERLTITLHWEALDAVHDDFTAFVHLWEPGSPVPLAQDDAPPRSGWYPTGVWQRGDQIPDTHVLILPPDLPPGRYPLWAGLYRSSDVARLPARGPAGRYPDDLVPLGEVEVR